MGGNWRMPTDAELYELINNTTNEWVTNYNGTGIKGRKFISKTDTSKYIFIPAAGDCSDGSVNGVGNYGNVWSSSLSTSGSYYAWHLSFSSGYCGINDDDNRSYGWSVRGVRK